MHYAWSGKHPQTTVARMHNGYQDARRCIVCRRLKEQSGLRRLRWGYGKAG